ncbi:SDR family NAD(P)-dependent oxidoreductase [Pandoraea sputorum]|uniref:Serine 3-dehydrogenase n=1 Tax=Pandoraea sputorum TaxID=93222 RepID=A0A239SG22_9BURK|nr:SDR family oxidoreductase [Pandoraea sputorum]AJC16624.1 SDR family oxidoreductase [Pandoraea sputorum]SNU83704.1 Serine 3-dehydrogenase [Pandoraea sputorum]VVD95965.1 SDR family oxidoreductase [Pandoraea sputorum]
MNAFTQIHQPGTALITGASSGIGAIYADRLARRGHDLILVARNTTRLLEAAQRLHVETGRRVDILSADLSTREGQALVEARLREDTRIDTLVNNAGFGAVAPLLQADVDHLTDMIEVNVTALTRLTYAAVPGFVARGRGTVINIASIVAIAPELLNDVYGGSKAFVLAFSQSLQHQLADTGVRVQAVLPGATITEFWDVAGKSHQELPQEWLMTSDDLVDAALAGLDQGETITIPPLQDGDEWSAYDTLRRKMSQGLSNASPGKRYGLKAVANAA